jgi:hypothetical protein
VAEPDMANKLQFFVSRPEIFVQRSFFSECNESVKSETVLRIVRLHELFGLMALRKTFNHFCPFRKFQQVMAPRSHAMLDDLSKYMG